MYILPKKLPPSEFQTFGHMMMMVQRNRWYEAYVGPRESLLVLFLQFHIYSRRDARTGTAVVQLTMPDDAQRLHLHSSMHSDTACRIIPFCQVSLLPRWKGPPARPTRAERALASQRPARYLWLLSAWQRPPSCSVCSSGRSGCRLGSPRR